MEQQKLNFGSESSIGIYVYMVEWVWQMEKLNLVILMSLIQIDFY